MGGLLAREALEVTEEGSRDFVKWGVAGLISSVITKYRELPDLFQAFGSVLLVAGPNSKLFSNFFSCYLFQLARIVEL